MRFDPIWMPDPIWRAGATFTRASVHGFVETTVPLPRADAQTMLLDVLRAFGVLTEPDRLTRILVGAFAREHPLAMRVQLRAGGFADLNFSNADGLRAVSSVDRGGVLQGVAVSHSPQDSFAVQRRRADALASAFTSALTIEDAAFSEANDWVLHGSQREVKFPIACKVWMSS